MRGKKVQIDKEMFELMCRYFLDYDDIFKEVKEYYSFDETIDVDEMYKVHMSRIEDDIARYLKDKRERLQNNELFREYITAEPGSKEREQKRKDYLHACGRTDISDEENNVEKDIEREFEEYIQRKQEEYDERVLNTEQEKVDFDETEWDIY